MNDLRRQRAAIAEPPRRLDREVSTFTFRSPIVAFAALGR